MAKFVTSGRSILLKKPNEIMRLNVRIAIGVLFGFLIGSFSPLASTSRLYFSYRISYTGGKNSSIPVRVTQERVRTSSNDQIRKNLLNSTDIDIYISTNPKGAERLPPGIIVSESDFYMHNLWGNPSKDPPNKQKYLVAFTVGYDQKMNIDAAVKKFSGNFTILLFHYDGRTNEWDELEWSKRAIHISASRQTKWWYAKRFLHPDVLAPYEYIFIWDEDLGLEHFNAEKYIEVVRKHGLEISQPGVQATRKNLTWQIAKRRDDCEVHKEARENLVRCPDPHLPPCAAFVEIMAPVFSRDAWRCVWHMIQNDLIHGWGLDFSFRKCVKPAHEKIGVVDSQWIIHQEIPSLGDQNQAGKGKTLRQRVRERCFGEWKMFHARMENAVKLYYKKMGEASKKSNYLVR